jgi:hypothetical protein
MDEPVAIKPNQLYGELEAMLQVAQPKGDEALFKAIVNSPFRYKLEMAFLFLGITVFLKVNPQTKTIDRIALSDTDLAKNTTTVSVVPFHEIKIGIDEPENIIAQAIRTGKPHDTTDWKYLFTPALTGEQARVNQASAGIAYSAVYPIEARDGAAMIFSYFQYQEGIGAPQQDFMRRYIEIVTKQLKL